MLARDLLAMALLVLGAALLVAAFLTAVLTGQWLIAALTAGAVLTALAGVLLGRYDPDAPTRDNRDVLFGEDHPA